jgi:hypothetical protein
MAKRTGKGKSKASISEDLVGGVEKTLIDHGKTYPHVPGLVRSLVPLAPPAFRVVLSYNFRASMTSTVSSLALYVFSGNGMFDPDITGTGVQPLGYDQWSTLYQRYRVLASSCTVKLTTPDEATYSNQNIRACLVPASTASTFTNFEAAASQPYAKTRDINGAIGPFPQMTSMMETSVFEGKTKDGVLSDDQLAALTSANPADQWYWHVYATSRDAASTSVIFLTGTIHYLVDFYDRNLLSMSMLYDAKRKKAEKRASKGLV